VTLPITWWGVSAPAAPARAGRPSLPQFTDRILPSSPRNLGAQQRCRPPVAHVTAWDAGGAAGGVSDSGLAPGLWVLASLAAV
jgi:hypothetical protein